MPAKEIGIFLSARHLATIAADDRKPDEVLDRVESAAHVLMLASGISHRIIAADCAEHTECEIAEQFAEDSGFRIRHCPARGPDQSAVLSAEILESLATSPSLRTFVIGDNLVAQSAAVEVIHRQRRWTIGLVGEYPVAPRLADLTYTMPLARFGLLGLTSDVMAEISGRGEEPEAQSVYRELSQRLSGFSPSSYGFDGMAQLISAAKSRSTQEAQPPPRTRTVSPAPVKPQKKTRNKKADPSSATRGRKTDPSVAAIRSAIGAFTVLSDDELTDLDEVAVGRRVLSQLRARPELRDALHRGALNGALFTEGMRQMIGDAVWRPSSEPTFFSLLRRCVEHEAEWVIASSPERPMNGVLILGELPDGWKLFTPSQTIASQADGADYEDTNGHGAEDTQLDDNGSEVVTTEVVMIEIAAEVESTEIE
ncbi:hypothetical protein SBI67_26920 [Mycolicibacterium sp. 120266]|uniref:hypothetical protein n=1 Tax=Mycolicibacterium sp. 120266 TaxID=3090601 RepID=UPI00299D5537|nr:hypothetical protein [Mycolicibacterium sp. 120266]MDX1875767.1 hypothetical protein [Mycolicibacterium sp. 120266]